MAIPSKAQDLYLAFQSPLGEVVKETNIFGDGGDDYLRVSIPSRGSGKGDPIPTRK